MRYLLQFLATAFFIVFLSEKMPGIELVDSYKTAFVFAIILALVNLLLGTVLRIITFPLRIITLGAFSFVILLGMVYVTDYLVQGITLTGIIPYVAIAFGSSVIAMLFKVLK
jgi:putative membrane protein